MGHSGVKQPSPIHYPQKPFSHRLTVAFVHLNLHPFIICIVLNIQVQMMDVRHPKDGAVYWEGPVNVSLEVTLAGEKEIFVRPCMCVCVCVVLGCRRHF